ncbi:uncharacterized protein TRUGW13939_00089 [Talaromyces rugulosus]|uniref:Uncharacterized protein n=1 Tax=Talaromyces rugulosus TaxID=121627 RepID=A0A7H8QGB0_TALRU|nr:uncharacterized protein TRUGW13939_00089 [Talaromyces rugulosus]QKX53018.1 hypothetical protein TRUGW13939_00089 [Talaromyces rugulosus]
MSALTITGRRSAFLLPSISPWRTLQPCKITIPSPATHARLRSTTESLPRIAQTSLWTSMVPKFLRNRGSQSTTEQKQSATSAEWNPATFYIIIFILIGSQAIQMLVLRKDVENFGRQADAKIRLLNEVIQRVKNGEEVDVEKLLGTGNESKEREWEEVLREIEEEDSLWRQKSGKSSNPTTENKSQDKSPKSTRNDSDQPQSANSAHSSADTTAKEARFY